jgi:hypothetical protein
VGAIAGGVAGGVVGLVLVAGLGFFLAKLGAGGVAAGGFGGAGAGQNPFAPEMQMHAAPGSGSVPGGVYHGGAHTGVAGYSDEGYYQVQGPDQGVGGYYSGGAEGAQPIQPLPHRISYAPQAATGHGGGALQSPGQQYSHLPNSGSGSGSGASYGPQAASSGGGGALHSPGQQYSPAPNSGSGSTLFDGAGTGARTSLPYAAQDSPTGLSGLAGLGSAARRHSAQHARDGASPATMQGFYGFTKFQG